MLILAPAYGRDYKSVQAVKADFEAEKDFIVQNFGHPYDGKPVNRQQLLDEGQVAVRYNQLRKVVILEV